jgi:hypothetical protein
MQSAVQLNRLATAFLRRMKLLMEPIGAMDAGVALFCASFILGTLLIAANSSAYFFGAYRSALTSGIIFKATLLSFSHYFITTICAEVLFTAALLLVITGLSRGKSREELSGGNLPFSILCSGIGLAVLLCSMATPVYEWITPVYLNFR